MSFQEALRSQLEEDDHLQRSRRLRVPEPGLLRFCDNDYLGLAAHPALRDAVTNALPDGTSLGSKAARSISGTTQAQLQLEDDISTFKESEAALLFSSGYTAALGCIPTLVGLDDLIVMDKLAHACLIDGAKLSGARLRVFPHNDLHFLEEILKEARSQSASQRILIIVESLYSMDGDFSPLVEIIQLKEKYDAWLMVDEAHSTGLYGLKGKGLCFQTGLSKKVEIQMGTLSKAAGVSGGFIAGSESLIQLLRNRSRPFLFTTSQPAILAAAASAALHLIQSEEGDSLRARLFSHAASFFGLVRQGKPDSPIFPIAIDEEGKALQFSRELEKQGFLVPAIRYPTVAKGKARLRVTLNSNHQPEDIRRLAECLNAHV